MAACSHLLISKRQKEKKETNELRFVSTTGLLSGAHALHKQSIMKNSEMGTNRKEKKKRKKKTKEK